MQRHELPFGFSCSASRLGSISRKPVENSEARRRCDPRAVGRKTTSKKEWVDPHAPKAKVGMTKHRACDMIYKLEHVADMETGGIVAAEVRGGDEGDTADLAARVLAAGETDARVCEDPK
jgi:hypothetical protein